MQESYFRAICYWADHPTFVDSVYHNARLFPIGTTLPEAFKRKYETLINHEEIIVTNSYGDMVSPLYMGNINEIKRAIPTERIDYELPDLPRYLLSIDPKYSHIMIKEQLKPSQWRLAFMILYFEESAALHKSKITHRHILKLSDVIDLVDQLDELDIFEAYATNTFPIELLTSDYRDSYEIDSATTPNERPFNRSTMETAKCFLRDSYPIDKIFGSEHDVYIVGSSLVQAFTLKWSNINDNAYNNADLDILVDVETWEEFDKYIEYLSKELTIEPIRVDIKSGYKYKFDYMDVFKACVGSIAGYHVPMVRCAFDGNDFIVTPSMLAAYKTGYFCEYRWLSSSKNAPALIKKYIDRGFYAGLSPLEMEAWKLYFDGDITGTFTGLRSINRYYVEAALPDYNIRSADGSHAMSSYRIVNPLRRITNLGPNSGRIQLHSSFSDLTLNPYASERVPKEFANMGMRVSDNSIIGLDYTIKYHTGESLIDKLPFVALDTICKHLSTSEMLLFGELNRQMNTYVKSYAIWSDKIHNAKIFRLAISNKFSLFDAVVMSMNYSRNSGITTNSKGDTYYIVEGKIIEVQCSRIMKNPKIKSGNECTLRTVGNRTKLTLPSGISRLLLDKMEIRNYWS